MNGAWKGCREDSGRARCIQGEKHHKYRAALRNKGIRAVIKKKKKKIHEHVQIKQIKRGFFCFCFLVCFFSFFIKREIILLLSGPLKKKKRHSGQGWRF